MKILIIEDELPAADQLSKAVKAYNAENEIVAMLDSNGAIMEWFQSRENMPDLIFSDIELLDGNVFNSLRQLDLTVPIIFTTAYHQFMTEAFDTSGIAYLLKPINPDSLNKALKKYENLTTLPSKIDLNVLLRKLNITQTNLYRSRFSVKTGKGIFLLKVDDIACLIMKSGVLHAYDSKGKSFLLSMNLNDAQEQFDPNCFQLINRSEIVNINFIQKAEVYTNDRLAVFIEGQQAALITSAARTSQFRKWIDGYPK